MKKKKIEIRIRISRPGVAAESITISNEYTDEEAKRRFQLIWPMLAKIAEDHMGKEEFQNAGGMARELAAQDFDNTTDDNG